MPVLCQAVIEGLITQPAGCYVDATIGGGGHTAALLDALAPEGWVIGIDRDPEALEAVRRRLADAIAAGRLQLVQGNFANLEDILDRLGVTSIDGLLLDLGVSSHQLDVGRRGFSFQAEGPLDMRMDPSSPGPTAAQLLEQWSAYELAGVLRHYGEEPRARKLARAIHRARPIRTTAELAEVVRREVPAREATKTLARVFQALRIAVNGELQALERVLEAATRRVRPGGRLAVLSYHSLEDRRVKRFLRYGNLEGKPVRDFYGRLLSPWRPLTRRAIRPSAVEIAANPRARSARLRIAERVAEPAFENP
ncbi:MAG: 16S rRNA (cytosine(1402)-N(4))-methyltransferase RsmH [Rhodothermus sp.]|nr:16S rRNA (cytosine(1402)-N(4))-methyltransferase RsmH [Rhodothermus sp.]